MKGSHVAVVGAGLAGLAAALECADRGARVTLVERRRRLGGLTWSFRHNSLEVDNGQHVHLACCEQYLSFIERIGATADLVPARPLDIPVVAPPARPGDRPVVGRLQRRRLPVPFHLAPALMRYPHLSVADRLSLGRALAGLARLDPDDPSTDRVTFGEWLGRHGQSPDAVAALWDLITIPTVNLPSSEASLAVAAFVFRTGLLSRPGAADMGWARVPLGRLHGERAVAALGCSRVRILTDQRVTAVRPRPGTGWQVVTPAGPIDSDMVVVAVPHEEAAAVLPPGCAPTQDRWAELGSSGIVDVHLVFDRRVTDFPVMAGYRSPVQWVFDRTESSGLGPKAGGGAQYVAVSLSAAESTLGERPERLVASTVAALGKLLPAVSGARLVDSLVTKEHRATFRAAPGTAALRPAAATAYPGLALAGAWTATGWPATMEGAVRSGQAAARALCDTRAAETVIPPMTPQEVA